MSGEKKVEFRKVRFRNEVSHAVVYASSPIQRVIGYFDITYIVEDSPADLWARYGAEAGIVQEEFHMYFNSSDRGIAIGIGKVQSLMEPVQLHALGSSLKPPQSFAYLDEGAFKLIQDCSRR
jgi:predicted transcriptional regulator